MSHRFLAPLLRAGGGGGGGNRNVRAQGSNKRRKLLSPCTTAAVTHASLSLSLTCIVTRHGYCMQAGRQTAEGRRWKQTPKCLITTNRDAAIRITRRICTSRPNPIVAAEHHQFHTASPPPPPCSAQTDS